MGTPRWVSWAVCALLLAGAGLTSTVLSQTVRDLRSPLESAVPTAVGTLAGEDVPVPDAEIEVAGVSDYLMRVYRPESGTVTAGQTPWASVYVGYYESQTQGKTIHSPKNCMPGAGWQALASTTLPITARDGGSVTVNRYLLVNEEQRVLVLYWYQGRGRVVASEYQAKWDLLRDASLRRRSDEALVRVVVPIVDTEEAALAIARELAEDLVPSLTQALPAA